MILAGAAEAARPGQNRAADCPQKGTEESSDDIVSHGLCRHDGRPGAGLRQPAGARRTSVRARNSTRRARASTHAGWSPYDLYQHGIVQARRVRPARRSGCGPAGLVEVEGCDDERGVCTFNYRLGSRCMRLTTQGDKLPEMRVTRTSPTTAPRRADAASASPGAAARARPDSKIRAICSAPICALQAGAPHLGPAAAGSGRTG